ncbi:hypothetical protein PV08_06523 [Exophiala spinifera]|uniref:Maintenance of telomere capping protein 6 n=1 Tax=Exophiala spinifera TaxID=91928 RepID=A0A0D2BYT7_9EURO|nr:uncharacterized protein PV08_06523 [Exophiala spinifera]KIW16469.1 hypothetical protein PV08_06523 [Exophiala spinifera]
MSLKYNPSSSAVSDAHWTTVFLSTRDASAEVPIDFITRPGVYLTQACFPNGVYDDIPAQTCLSDLLASGFGRIVIDLYWDNINRQFNLCPVELPPLAGNSTAGYSVDFSALSSITSTTSSALNPTEPLSAPTIDPLVKRQSGVNNTTTSISATPATTSVTSAAPIPTTTGVAGTELLELGPFKCSLDLNLDSIMSLYNDYFDQTSDTISARLHYITFNLHAASPFTAPSESANTPMQARLPRGDSLIGSQFEGNLPQDLYTPDKLQDDRDNLDKSWLEGNTDSNYFIVDHRGDDSITTDGWPGESSILLASHRRLLLSWGEVDPQMRAYDFQNDSGNVFPSDYLAIEHKVTINDEGDITSGCFYDPGVTTIGAQNSSGAYTTINNIIPSQTLQHMVQNLTACGISPMLNVTLGNLTVQNDLDAYQQFARSTVFGWASGEPRTGSQTQTTQKRANDDDEDYACAVMDSTSGYMGRWRVEPCQKQHRAACRIAEEPFAWRLSTYEVPFQSAPDACPESTTFSLPRTGLENTYLYRKIMNDSSSGGDESILSGVWIDFNSLDQTNCWVSGGPNASCPYNGPDDSEDQREVLIPTIAALIVLILTVLTLLVKCNENRRNSRTRSRRGDDGWEYEGVPS